MTEQGPMPPQGRMIVAIVLGLFFGGFAFGSLHSARQEYRWRNATTVHGVLVKHGSKYHYEYRPKGQPPVVGASIGDQHSDQPDGVIDDWVDVDYDPHLPELLRRHYSKGRAATNYGQFLITVSAGALFSLAVLLCLWKFLRAWSDLRRRDAA